MRDANLTSEFFTNTPRIGKQNMRPDVTDEFFSARPNAVAPVLRGTVVSIELDLSDDNAPHLDSICLSLDEDCEELGLSAGDKVTVAMSAHPADSNSLIRDIGASEGSQVVFTDCTVHLDNIVGPLVQATGYEPLAPRPYM